MNCSLVVGRIGTGTGKVVVVAKAHEKPLVHHRDSNEHVPDDLVVEKVVDHVDQMPMHVFETSQSQNPSGNEGHQCWVSTFLLPQLTSPALEACTTLPRLLRIQTDPDGPGSSPMIIPCLYPSTVPSPSLRLR